MAPALGLRLRDPATFIATAGGAGLLPGAPGTWGSLVGAVLAWVVAGVGGPISLLTLALLLFVVGCWAAQKVSQTLGIADPGCIVIDEVVGQALVLANKIHNGFGVMIDDVAAAVYAAIVLALGLRCIGQ